MAGDPKDSTNTGKYSIESEGSSASIPTITRLLNRKSFKQPSAPKPAAAPPTPPPRAALELIKPPAAVPPPLASPPPASPATLQVRLARRSGGESAPSIRFVPQWNRAALGPLLVGLPSGSLTEGLERIAESWKRLEPQFGGKLLVVFQKQGQEWRPMGAVGEPPQQLAERGGILGGMSWSESLTPVCFQLWRKLALSAIDLEESGVPAMERSALSAALGLNGAERATLLPSGGSSAAELILILSTGRVPQELVKALAVDATSVSMAKAA